MYYVYVILNERKSYYIGYTEDIEDRVNSHNTDFNRSTKGHKWELAYYEAYVKRNYALKREKQLKRNGRMRQFLIARVKSSLE